MEAIVKTIGYSEDGYNERVVDFNDTEIFLGTERNSVGPYGESDGYFAYNTVFEYGENGEDRYDLHPAQIAIMEHFKLSIDEVSKINVVEEG